MIELLEQKLKNVYKTYRMMARQAYRMITKQDKAEKKYKDDLEEFKEAVKAGDIDAVEKDFNDMVQQLQELFRLNVEIENLDVLFCHELEAGITDEAEKAKRVNNNIVHLRVDKSLLEQGTDKFNEHTRKALSKHLGNINTVKELADALEARYKKALDELKAIHKKGMDELYLIIKQYKDMHWDFERLRDEMYANFSEYNARQEARFIRWNIRSGQRDIKKVERDEKELYATTTRIASVKDVEEILKALKRLSDDIKDENSEVSKLFRAVRSIFQLSVYRFFIYKGQEEKEKGFIHMLKEEGYPEDKLNYFRSELKKIDDMVNQKVLDAERTARISYQKAS